LVGALDHFSPEPTEEAILDHLAVLGRSNPDKLNALIDRINKLRTA
jgi:hypothetical protein